METTQIYVDDSNFVAFVDGMKSSRVRSLEKQALRRTGSILQKDTKKTLKVKKGSVLAKSARKNDWYKGIRLSVQKTTKGEQFFQVHILGFYILKWWEKGTDNRRTKKSRGNGYRARLLDTYGTKQWIHQRGTKPHDTGRIKPIWFFKETITRDKERLFQAMQDEWKKIIVKEFMTKGNVKYVV